MLRSVYFCIKPSLRKCEQDAYHTRLGAREPTKLAERQRNSARLWFRKIFILCVV